MTTPTNLFGSVQLDPEQQKTIKLARMDAEQLLSRAESLPESRYKSLFTTTLENSIMWFNKAVSSNKPPPLPFDEEPDHGD